MNNLGEFVTFFVESLKRLLDEKSISRNDLSARSGITQPTVSRLFNGLSQPTIETIEKLAKGFDCSVLEFFESDPAKAMWDAHKAQPAPSVEESKGKKSKKK